MVADIARLGALFLFAAVIPAWTAQSLLLDQFTQTQAVAISLVGGAGVGAAVHAFGGGIWAVLFAYGRSLREVVQRRPATGLRAEMADHHPEILKLTYEITNDRALGQELTTSFTFHGRAPMPLVEWARRRHGRFREGLDSALALLLGSAVSLWFPDWGWSRIGLSAVVLLGAASLVFGAFEQRKQAEAMELLWHRMGDPPDAASLLAGSPQTERRPDPEDLIPTPE